MLWAVLGTIAVRSTSFLSRVDFQYLDMRNMSSVNAQHIYGICRHVQIVVPRKVILVLFHLTEEPRRVLGSH